jgi:hypothetical protein
LENDPPIEQGTQGVSARYQNNPEFYTDFETIEKNVRKKFAN